MASVPPPVVGASIYRYGISIFTKDVLTRPSCRSTSSKSSRASKANFSFSRHAICDFLALFSSALHPFFARCHSGVSFLHQQNIDLLHHWLIVESSSGHQVVSEFMVSLLLHVYGGNLMICWIETHWLVVHNIRSRAGKPATLCALKDKSAKVDACHARPAKSDQWSVSSTGSMKPLQLAKRYSSLILSLVAHLFSYRLKAKQPHVSARRPHLLVGG